jgi:hypothetical protein
MASHRWPRRQERIFHVDLMSYLVAWRKGFRFLMGIQRSEASRGGGVPSDVPELDPHVALYGFPG